MLAFPVGIPKIAKIQHASFHAPLTHQMPLCSEKQKYALSLYPVIILATFPPKELYKLSSINFIDSEKIKGIKERL